MKGSWKLIIATVLVSWLVTVVLYTLYLPRLEMYRNAVKLESRSETRLNAFFHLRQLASPADRSVVRPNNDTLYSSAVVDLALSGPLLLSVPDTGERYYSFQFIDMDTDVFEVVGRRSTGPGPARYLIVGPGWQGNVAAGISLIRAPQNRLWLLGRTLVDGPDDLAAVHALQDNYRLEPYSP